MVFLFTIQYFMTFFLFLELVGLLLSMPFFSIFLQSSFKSCFSFHMKRTGDLRFEHALTCEGNINLRVYMQTVRSMLHYGNWIRKQREIIKKKILKAYSMFTIHCILFQQTKEAKGEKMFEMNQGCVWNILLNE